jgi:hypothetical protein
MKELKSIHAYTVSCKKDGSLMTVVYDKEQVSQEEAEAFFVEKFGGLPTMNSRHGVLHLRADSWGQVDDRGFNYTSLIDGELKYPNM